MSQCDRPSADQAAPPAPQGLVRLFQRAESAAPGGAFVDAMSSQVFGYADSRNAFADTTAR